MKILHITSWYPNQEDEREAIWIKNHINSLPADTINHILHLEVRDGKFYINADSDTPNYYQFRLKLPTKRWSIIEIVNLLALWYFLQFRCNAKTYDVVNFHIAYPQLTYIKYLKYLLPDKIFITEHWSAYHLNFGVKKRLLRIERIFHQGFQLITVSKALGEDIKRFSRNPKLYYQVVPNTVNTDVFYYDHKQEKDNILLMISGWKYPKDPFTVIRAFAEVLSSFPEYKLAIGGYGSQWSDMQKFVKKLDITDHVVWLGKLRAEEIATWQRKSKLFLHCSEYETFSVVVAEALCCGTPVVASAVGGIKELLHIESGILIEENNKEHWKEKISEALSSHYEYGTIASEAIGQFSFDEVGKRYYEVLSS